MSADAGIVKTHAHTIRPAMPQGTADKRRMEPTPIIAPVMVCVVLTGTPRCVAVNNEIAPAVSAAKPPTGWSLVIFDPIVWMMRQPPDNVPRAMAADADRMTHSGIGNAPLSRLR